MGSVGTALIARWVTWDCNSQSLSSFLTDWVPSKTVALEVEWILVSRLKASKIVNSGVSDLMRSWSNLCAEKRVNCANVKRLAQEHGVTSGKWLIFVSSETVDELWKLVANAVVNGKLGDDCKVSTASRPKREKKPTKCGDTSKPDEKDFIDDIKPSKSKVPEDVHVICVYAPDFDDYPALIDQRKKLYELGFHDKLQFKPDAYSFCGIYTGNQWHIPPISFSR